MAEKLTQHPVFAQVAVNPYYFQLYSSTASQPIRYSYTRYTIAGVFLGYRWRDDYPYWIFSVRRHNVESNRIHLKLNLNNPFGNMGGKMFEVVAALADYDRYQKKLLCSVCSVRELVDLSVNCTHLTVRSHCLNDVVIAFNLNAYKRLQLVQVEDFSLRRSPALILNGLPLLKKVVIGANSFSEVAGDVPNTVFSKNKRVVLKNLPLLESFVVGPRSFADFIQLVATNLPEIASFSVGVASSASRDVSNNFFWASQLRLAQMPKLKTLVVGNYAFSGVDFLTLAELPALETVTFGYGAFFGYSVQCAVDSAVSLDSGDERRA